MIASATDLDLAARSRSRGPTTDVYRAAVAVDVLAARRGVAALLTRAGAEVIEAPADGLAAMCVRTYLRAKTRVRV